MNTQTEDLKEQLKDSFTNYWEPLTLRTACELGIFDRLENNDLSLEKLATSLLLDKEVLNLLLRALLQLDAVQIIEEAYSLKEKGALLAQNHPESLKNACLFWVFMKQNRSTNYKH